MCLQSPVFLPLRAGSLLGNSAAVLYNYYLYWELKIFMKGSNTRINPQKWVVKHDSHLETVVTQSLRCHRNKPAWAKPWEEPFIQLIPELNSVKACGNPTEMQRNLLLYAHKSKHTTYKQQCRRVWMDLKGNSLMLYIVLLLLLSPSFCCKKEKYNI